MLHLPATISVREAESLISGLGAREDAVSVDVTDYRHDLPLAETAVHAFVRLASWRRIRLTLRISSTAAALRTFSESGTGFLLCQSASSFLDRDNRDCLAECRSWQRSFLRDHNGLLSVPHGFVLPVADNVVSPPAVSGLLKLESLPAFRENFSYLLASHFGESFLRMRGLDWVARYAFEILQNTRDHATTNIDGKPVRGSRFLLVRRVGLDGEGFDALTAVPVIADYIKILQEIFAGRVQELVEVTISDSGVGIPARIAGTTEIYDKEDREGQRKWFELALSESGTSKRGIKGAGLGLPTAMRAVADTRGLVVFRTGHLNLYRHYFSGAPFPDKTLQVFKSSAPFSSGTSVTLLLPRLARES
jgi:hypothetical protein